MITWATKTKALATVALLSCLCVPASALTIAVDGSISDWGVANAAQRDGNNWTPDGAVLWWWSEDSTTNGYVGPGVGGQDFDLEAMYAYLDEDTLYFALVTGFDPQGEVGNNRRYYAGDVFFDFGQDGWDLAVGTDINGERGGADAGTLWTGTGEWWQDPIDFPASTPYRVDTGDASQLPGSALFSFSDVISDPGTTNQRYDHNVLELCLTLTPEQMDAFYGGGFAAHWTMGCGNDVGEISGDMPVVPEPASMMLLSLGIAGLAVRSLRRKFRS